MAKRKSSPKSKIKKAVRKSAKKYPILTASLILVLILIVVVLYILHTKGTINIPIFDKILNSSENNNEKNTTYKDNDSTNADIDLADGIFEDFQIHFMMLGNDKAGDSIYIKAGDTDLLIDAGSRSYRSVS